MNERENLAIEKNEKNHIEIDQTFNLTIIGTHLVRYYSLFLYQITETLEHIFLFATVYSIVCIFIYLLIFQSWATKCCRWFMNRRFPACKRILFVIAHPDDESMFFGPTIRSLSHTGCQIYLLCLSNGLLQSFNINYHYFYLSYSMINKNFHKFQVILSTKGVYVHKNYGMHVMY